ncbi:MAG: DNA repair protein RadC [Flavobacteriaceae bacterium]
MQQKSVTFSINKWSDADKPREKLRYQGRNVLTNAELIAILIGSGNREETAVELARRILYTTGNNLAVLSRLSVEELMKFKGIGEAKAIAIVAALEIGRRKGLAALPKRKLIKNSSMAFELMHAELADLPHEEFWILYLNNANKVLQRFQISKGGITGTLVDVRLVMKKALDLGAVSLIMVHNHPSGTLKPSQADKEITQQMVDAAKTLKIKVLDHLIITQASYFSFADNKLLPSCS